MPVEYYNDVFMFKEFFVEHILEMNTNLKQFFDAQTHREIRLGEFIFRDIRQRYDDRPRKNMLVRTM